MTTRLVQPARIGPLAAVLAALALPGSALAQDPDTVALPDTAGAADSVAVETRPSEADTTANLVGTVASSATGKPINGARVSIPELQFGAITAGRGNFEITNLPPGLYDVEVHYLGYTTNQRPIRLRPGRVTDATFLLKRDVLEVADLTVRVKRTDRNDPMSEFRRRMKAGFGEFITREEIERRSPREVTDLFRTIPGVDVSDVRYGRAQIRMKSGQSPARGTCRPVVYVDGVMRREFSVDNLDPEAIQGIEIYRRLSETPPKFNVDVRCGVIVIHTRVAAEEAGSP